MLELNGPATAATAGRSPTVAIFNVAMIGHVNPTFALVQELVRRGCRVHYFLPAVEQICSAAKESGAEVESYLPDMPDLVLEHCGIEEPHEEILPDEQALWERAVWPLASTLLCGEYLIQRCRALGVSVVLYDPMTPHGLLVAQKLNLPKASLVTYPGMGSLADLMKEDRLLRAAKIRAPYGRQVYEKFGVDLEVELLTRRQYFAPVNFITTCDALVAPLPDAPWAMELSQRFRFEPVGCLVSPQAPHVAQARSAASKVPKVLKDGLPVEELTHELAAGHKIIFAALGTMALSDRWSIDLGRASGGNLPPGTTGKEYCQHVWRALLEAMELLGKEYYCVLCAGKQSDALDFLESEDALPSNVIVRTCVPQVEMLNDYASCFLSHVGFNSLQESLMAGVPLVAVPQAVDQPANAMKVQKMSWGVSFLRPMASVTSTALAVALEDVLQVRNRRFRAAVQAAQRDLAGGVQRLAEEVLEL